MRKIFFRFFFSIILVTVSVILIQTVMLMNRYIAGQKKWKQQIFERFSSGLVDALDGTDSREQLYSRLNGLFYSGLDDRVSGYVLRSPSGEVLFTVGKAPDGRPLLPERVNERHHFISEKILKSVFSKRYSYVIEIDTGESLNAKGHSTGLIGNSKNNEHGIGSLVPSGVIGTIKILLNGREHVLVDLVAFSPMNYVLTGEMMTACMKSLVLSIFVCIFVAACGAFFISRSNALFIERVRTALDDISARKENIRLPDTKNGYLNDIFRMIHDLDLRLQANAKSRRLWLNSISHDLNTPAMSMKVIIDGISDGVFSPDSTTISQLRLENDVLNERIGRVRVLTSLQADTVPVIDTVDTAVFCRGVIESMGPNANVVLNIGSPFIKCDCTLMHSACCEFLKNALQYSDGSSSVVWNVSSTEKEYAMSFSNPGKLPSEYNAQDMFEPWTRGDWSRSGEGNGLGLPIGGTIVYLHHGDATISQKDGFVTLNLVWPSY